MTRVPVPLASYARALIPKRGGGAFPQARRTLAATTPDAARLRRYAEVCGFAVRGAPAQGAALPVTYPQLVAFPAAMSLLARRDFPLPMLGLVHIANEIECRRPLAPDEPLAYDVRLGQPFPHPRGTAFRIVTEAADTAGSAVWRSAATYLSRGRPPSGEPREPAAPAAVGPRPDRADDWAVPSATGRRYARASGDRNPIHLHPLTARAFGFPRAIAHGMWTKARCLAGLADVSPDACRVAVTFHAPVLLPARVRFRAARTAGGWSFELADRAAARTHLRGGIG